MLPGDLTGTNPDVGSLGSLTGSELSSSMLTPRRRSISTWADVRPTGGENDGLQQSEQLRSNHSQKVQPRVVKRRSSGRIETLMILIRKGI